MKNKRILLFFFLLVFFAVASAQPHLRKTSLSPVGDGTAVSGSVSLIDAGGEVFNAESEISGLHLSEGFIGPDIAQIMGVTDYAHLDGVSLYPNPVSRFLQVALPQGEDFEIHIHDLTGKEIWHREQASGLYRIDMGNYHRGVYLLTVIDRKNHRFVTFKIQKS